jgi:hypothetical protein
MPTVGLQRRATVHIWADEMPKLGLVATNLVLLTLILCLISSVSSVSSVSS